MKKTILCIFGFILITSSLCSQSANKDLQQLRDSYITALKNSDTEGILKVYSDDASIHHIDGSLLNGAQEIKSFYDQFFENSKASIEFENVSEDRLAKDLFFYHDKVFLDIQGEDERRNIEVVNIAKKINGKWRVIKSYRWPMPE